jgi:hypothetical protein
VWNCLSRQLDLALGDIYTREPESTGKQTSRRIVTVAAELEQFCSGCE